MLLHCLSTRGGRWCLGGTIACMILIGLLVFLPLKLLQTKESIIPLVVNGTTLFELDFDNATSTIAYNFTVVLRFHNPNVLLAYFHKVEMTPLYAGGKKIGPEVKLPTFILRRKKTVVVPTELQGGQTLGGKDATAVARTYAEEAGKGYFTVETYVHVPGYEHWYDFVCTLHFPALGAANLFSGDACIVVKSCYHTRYGTYFCTGG